MVSSGSSIHTHHLFDIDTQPGPNFGSELEAKTDEIVTAPRDEGERNEEEGRRGTAAGESGDELDEDDFADTTHTVSFSGAKRNLMVVEVSNATQAHVQKRYRHHHCHGHSPCQGPRQFPTLLLGV